MQSRALLSALVVILALLASGCRSAPRGVRNDAATSRSAAPHSRADRGRADRGRAARSPAAHDEQQVFIDMSVVRIPEAEADRVLGAFRPGSVSEPTLLTKTEASALLAAWRDDPAVRFVNGPKILALNHGRASLSVGEMPELSKAHAERSSQGLTISLDEDSPGPVFLGFRMLVTPDISDDSSLVALTIHEAWREAKPGAPTEAALRGSSAQFRKEHTHGHSYDLKLELPDNGTALVGDPAVIEDNEGRHVRLTLVTVRVLTETQAVRAVTSNPCD